MSDNERVEALVKKLNQLVDHIENAELKAKVQKMLQSDEELFYSYISAPASTQTQYGGAYIGGLLNYSIITTSILKKLSDNSVKLPTDDIIIAGLFHHLGKIGYPEKPLYVKKESDWHNKNGIMYEYNKEFVGSGVNHNLTSLWYLAQNGIVPSSDAFEAISALTAKSNSSISDEFTQNKLTVLLLAASRLAWIKLANDTNS